MSSPRDRIEARLGLAGPPLQKLRAGSPAVPDHELIRRIGQGGYGEVWLARNSLGSLRAVKVVYRDSFKDDRPYEREFAGIRSFEPLSRHNEGFVDVLHVGRNDAEGWFYYVMELADDAGGGRGNQEAGSGSGATVASMAGHSDEAGFRPPTSDPRPSIADYAPRMLLSDLRRSGRLPLDQCLELGLTLTLALGYLHRHGLIHRDVKPSNIIFVGGVAKLADIGLVTEAGEANTFVGTEGFVPPEGPGTPSADLYALGKVLYEAAMGKDRQEFPEPHSRLGIDRESLALMEFNAVLLRACASDPKARYASAEEMHADLALLQSGRSVTRVRRLERRLRLVTRGVAGLAVLAMVVALGWWWQAGQTQKVRELAMQKAALLEDNWRLTQTQEGQIIRAYAASGVQRMEADDPVSALPWLVEVLRRVETNAPGQIGIQRLRLGNLLRYQPRLLAAVPVTGAVRTLAFSPDGRWIAAGSDAWSAEIIDVSKGAIARSLAHSNGVKSVEFSADSRRLLTGCRDGLARLWNVDTTNAPLLLPHRASVRHATFSPDGELVLTASMDKTARLWRAVDGQPAGPPLVHTQSLYHACFSPDGRRIATGTGKVHGSGELHLWDVESRTELCPPTVLKDLATWTAFNPDGTRLASACGEVAFDLIFSRPGVLVDGRSGAFIRNLELIDRIPHVNFSPDGKRLALATMANETLIADGDTGVSKQLVSPLKHSRWVHRSAFSPDGRWVASASSDGTARVWDAATGVPVTAPLRHPGEVYCVAFDPTGRLLATAGDGELVYVWDIGHAEPDLASMWYSRGETGILLTPDGRQAITFAPRRPAARSATYYPDRGDEPVRVYDLETGRMICSFPIPGGTPFDPIAVAPDGRSLALGSYNGRIRIGDLRDGKIRWETEALPGLCEPQAFSHDGHLLAVSMLDTADPTEPNSRLREVRLFSAVDGTQVGPPLVHPRPAKGIAFSPEDRVVVTACHDGRLRLWEVATGRLLRTLKVVDGELDEVRFSRDGRRLLVPGKHAKSAQLLDVETGVAVIPPLRHTGIVWDAMFDAEERRILTVSTDMSVAQWDAGTGERIGPPMLHQRGVNNACYDGAGRLVASAGADRTVRLWNAENGELLAIPFRYAVPAQSAELNQAGDRLVTSSADGRAQTWRLAPTDWPVDDLRRYAEAVAGQALSADGHLRTLSASEIASRIAALRVERPGDFSVSAGQWEQWHRRSKQEAEGMGNDFSARFHGARLEHQQQAPAPTAPSQH